MIFAVAADANIFQHSAWPALKRKIFAKQFKQNKDKASLSIANILIGVAIHESIVDANH